MRNWGASERLGGLDEYEVSWDYAHDGAELQLNPPVEGRDYEKCDRAPQGEDYTERAGIPEPVQEVADILKRVFGCDVKVVSFDLGAKE